MKPIPERTAPPKTCPKPTPRGSRPQTGAYAGPGRQTDAEELADDQGNHHGPGEPRTQGVQQDPVAQVDAGVGEREHRHDHVAGPGVQPDLETFVDRHGADELAVGRTARLHPG